MVKVNLGGCSSFVNDADYKANVEKALEALDRYDFEAAIVDAMLACTKRANELGDTK